MSNIMSNLYVIAYNKADGKRVKFTSCPKNNAKFYEELYKSEGYGVKVFTGEEIDKIIESGEKDISFL